LLDPNRTAVVYSIGSIAISEQVPSQPGRTLSDLVNDQPGWLYEANGTLHPRGSEYDVQYVLDGIPLTQNRSPSFAPDFDSEEVEGLRVLTGGYPAEYGRKLGGVVEVSTRKNADRGWHGLLELGGGSFSSTSGSAQIGHASEKEQFLFDANGFHTDRYL